MRIRRGLLILLHISAAATLIIFRLNSCTKEVIDEPFECRFDVDNNDPSDPNIPVTIANQKGLSGLGKGLDIWDCQQSYFDFTPKKMMDFADNIYCY